MALKHQKVVYQMLQIKLNDFSQLGELKKAFEYLKTKQLSVNDKMPNIQTSYNTISIDKSRVI